MKHVTQMSQTQLHESRQSLTRLYNLEHIPHINVFWFSFATPTCGKCVHLYHKLDNQKYSSVRRVM
jgi:hypothetical protein